MLVIQEYRHTWTTPNSVRLAWTLESYDEVSHYEIEFASSRAALEDPAAVQIIDGSTNPELAQATLARTLSASDIVDATIVSDLNAGSPYAFRLVAFDTAGGVVCSEVVSVFTDPDVLDELSLYDGGAPRGYVFPACATQGDALVYDYRCERQDDGSDVATCDPIATPGVQCWENVGVDSAGIDVASWSDGIFSRAFLEVEVAFEDVQAAYWGEVALRLPPPMPGVVYEFQTELTIPSDGRFRTLQVPLTALGLTRDLLASAGDRVTGFRIGTLAANGSRISIRKALLRF